MKRRDRERVARRHKSVHAGQPFERRKDWAIAYRTATHESWQADFSGVTRLSATGALYWLNAWERPGNLFKPREFGLSIKAKDGPEKPVKCQLRTTERHPERYSGRLQMPDGTRYSITLWPDDWPPTLLSIHFIKEADPP